MNSIQIHNVLTKYVKYFPVIYPTDLLPSTLIKPSRIAINFDKHHMVVSHWVAVCFSNSGFAEYFDSYGLPPVKYEIMAYLQRHLISWTFNRHRRQGLTSNVCGHCCGLCVLHRGRELSMTPFNTVLPSRYTCNDKKAMCVSHSVWSVPLAASW